jgi:hypothetical protein
MEKILKQGTGFFKPRRFLLLLRRDFSNGYRSVLIAMAAVSGFIILVSALSALQGGNGKFHTAIFAQLLFLGGYIVSSLAFKELHQPDRSYFYCTLPGSLVEKFFSKLLVTSLGYALGILIFYTIVGALSEGINRLIFGRGHYFFNPMDMNILLMTAVYLVTQSVFLTGSVYFRKLAFFKTTLIVNGAAIAFGLIIALTFYLIFRDYIHPGGLEPGIETILNKLGHTGQIEAELGSFVSTFSSLIKILFWYVLAPVCWLISYFRLSETEV